MSELSLMEKEIGCKLNIQGHVILVKAPVFPEKTVGGIYRPDGYKEEHEKKYDTGLVIGMGPEAYNSKERFPSGPRCKIGDWVDFAPMEKQRKTYGGHRCYVIEDDTVNLTIDPEEMSKALPDIDLDFGRKDENVSIIDPLNRKQLKEEGRE